MRCVTLDKALYELQDGMDDVPQRQRALYMVQATSLEILSTDPDSPVDHLRTFTLEQVMHLYGGYGEEVRKVDDFLLWMTGKRERPIHTGLSQPEEDQLLVSPYVQVMETHARSIRMKV